MNELQQSILEAINVLSKANDVNNVQTITIEATIESVDDAVKGIYTVNYMNNVFQAYSNGNSYQKGQQVYVLVPNGDFTKKKIIISSVGANALSQIQEDNSRYIFTSNNIILDGDIPYSLCSYQNEVYSWNTLSEDNKLLFYKYAQKQKVFQLSCDIKTTLSSQQIDKRGYYYLIFTYAIIAGGESIPQNIILDVSNILGNPYQLNDWANQSIVFTLDDNIEIDKNFIPTLTIGCNNFIQDDTKTEKDIFFRNFSLQSLEDATAVEGYKLYLTADNGIYMRSLHITSTKLVPELRYDGAIVDLAGAECFWFEQDAAVTVDSEKFFSYGGPGWACLNQRKSETNDQGESFTYFITDKNFSRIISESDILFSKTYKCVIIKDNITYSTEIEISQLNSDFTFTLVSDNKVYEKNAGSVVLTATTDLIPIYNEKLTFDWIRQDKNKKYLDNDFYEVRSFIKNQQEIVAFPTRIVNEINYITCSLRSNIRGLIASKTIAISVSEQLGYKLVIENGDVSYKYDASGKSQYLGAGYVSGSATAQPIVPLTFKIYKDNGSELNTEEYLSCNIKWRIPKVDSLLVKVDEPVEETDEYYIFSGMSLNYNVASYYNKSSVNNKIFLDIVFGDKILSAVAQPHFIMDGAMGTNGTKINTIIRYKGYAYDEEDAQDKNHICKLIYIQQDEGIKCYDEEGNLLDGSTALPFVLDVYISGKKVSENGVWINGTPPAEVANNCTWSIIDAFGSDLETGEIKGNNNLDALYFPNIDGNSSGCPIIKAEIAYAGKTVTTYYPLDMIMSDKDDINKLMQFNLEGGFHSILYNNAGYYPIYDHTPFKFFGPDEYKDDMWITYPMSNHFYIPSSEYDTAFIKYNKSFNYEVAENFQFIIDDYISLDASVILIMHSEEHIQYARAIVAMCNTYSLTSMNNWDGQKVQINDEESIYAPILGAGKKESNNTFSGFLMGDIKEANVTDTSPRFTAYHKGVRTFNIDSKTGKVSIGAGNGQIIIDPDANGNVDGCKAVIKSGNYTGPSGGAGMEIDFTDPHIYFGSGKFKVESDGKLTATGVDISGKITAGEGEIGGWKINTSSLTGGYVTLNKDGSIAGNSTYKWSIGANGAANFSNLTITGGSINVNNKFKVDSQGNVTLPSGTKLSWADVTNTENIATKSYVTGQGYETAASIKSTVITKDYIETLAIRAGSVAAENITGTTITGKAFSGGSINIGNGTFAVDGNGKVTCSNLNVTGGEIKLGGLTLDSNGLSSSSTATKFGPFKCDSNSIFANVGNDGWQNGTTKTPTVFMCTGSVKTGGVGQTIAGQTQDGWCFGAGHRFGVDIDGNVYCSAIKIKGESTSNATSTIGDMSVFSDYLLIDLGYATNGNQYFMTFGNHGGYLVRIYSVGSSGENTVFGITTSGTKVGF